MNNIYIYAVLLGVLGGVIGSMLFLFPYLKKKGIDVGSKLDTAQKIVDDGDKILSIVKPILPKNQVVNVLDIIDKWAKIAVGNSEQLYHAGELGPDDRKVTAENVVTNVAEQAGITVDENKKQLIHAAIESAVNDLGHTDNPVVVAKPVVQPVAPKVVPQA